MKRIGLATWGGMTTDELMGCVKVADSVGYENMFLIESYADQYAMLGACARETTRIRLGTGVTTAFYRTPTSLAIAGATVDALSHGRFILGLGVGHREIVAMRDDVEPSRPLVFEKPLQRLRETIEVVRLVGEAAMRNEPCSYRGEIFEVREYLPWISAYRARFPIYLGSFFEQGWELAGELADGVLPIFMPLDLIPAYTAAVARGAERAQRDPAEIDLACYIPCCVDEDEERARTAMQYLVAFHMSSYVHYRKWFVGQGHGAVVDRVAEHLARNEAGKAAALVTEEMLAGITVYGTAEHCAAQIARYRAAGIGLPIVYPFYPEFVGYLPNPASRAGILRTVEALATA